MTASDDDMIRRGDAIDRITKLSCDDDAHWGSIVDALRTIPSTQVSVKPLEWVYDEMRGVWSAQDGFGRHYTVSDSQWFHGSLSEFIWVDGGYEAAKAAAQADYEARILSALDMQPTVSPELLATTHDVAALVEAAEKVINSYWHSTDGVITGIYDLEAALARVKGGA